MNRVWLFLIVLLLIFIAFFGLENSETKSYQFDKVTNNVYVIYGPLDEPNPENRGFMNNIGLIVGEKGVVIVDPGSTLEVGNNALVAVKKMTNKPIVAVFNTHVHGDHWLGNQAIVEHYPNVKIYAHPNMIAQAKGGEGERWVKLMHDLTKGASEGTIATYPTDSTKNLQVINASGETFKIHNNITGSAHTNTDIMIEHIESKTLFLGDNGLVNRHGRFDSTADMHGNIKVLEYAKDLNLDHYIPGHGQSGNIDTVVKPFLNYLRIVKDEVTKGYEEDLADYEIKPIAHNKLGHYHDWHGYDENFGRHINKMLLEVEDRD